jgi:glycosyltransferase involved in cell wall biosynthesis
LCLNFSDLKVVHIIEALGGGVYSYFKDLSFFFGEQSQKEGVETYIIYSGGRKEIDPAKIRQEFSDKVTLIEVPMVKQLSPAADLKSARMLYKELKKIKPDIIHLHSSKAGVLGRVAGFFLKGKKKMFYTPHGYSFLQADISNFNKTLYKFIEKYVPLFLGGSTIACGDTEHEIAQSIGKSQLVRNGISIDSIKKFYKKPNNSRLKIGIVGRITYPRAPWLFNEIALKFPDFDFVWIGDGELRHEITAPNITVTGWFMDPKEVLNNLSELDIYMQTSLWEGLPIAVLEAMALHKPVIATNVIGNKDIVVPNETGFLFNEVSELEKYFDILKDEQTRLSFGENAFERCKLLFDKDKNFMQLLELYRK